ncbi:MAG: UrcA family protein [Pseudohongiellaceae bacterium]|jgi:UrcA family protein
MNNLLKPLTIMLVLAIPAIASADIETNQLAENEVSVTYNANDTSTNYGRVELERQIRHAAEKVCGSRHLRQAGSIGQAVKNRTCYNKAVTKALNSVKPNA